MKKIFIGLSVLAVAACSYLKGDYTLGRRNTFNDFFYTYNIKYYDTDAFDHVSKETETVSDYKLGVVRYAVPGGIVVSSKILQKDVYSEEFVRPSVKGALVSYTVPVEFSDEKVYRTIGESEINGKVYRLVEPSSIGDVILIDKQGKIYKRVGRIFNDRLALLKTSFILEPADVIFKNEVENRVGNEDVISGFEVRYAGIENYQMVFKYSSVRPNGDLDMEEQKTYRFPMYDKNVSIDGIELEILDVSDSGIEYKINSI